MAGKKDNKTRAALPDRKTYPQPNTFALMIAETAAGPRGRNPEFSKKIKDKFGIPHAFLTEARWDDISTGTGLKYYVRNEINIAMQKYWGDRLSESDAVAINKKLKDARIHLLGKAIPGVYELMHDKAMFYGMPASYEKTFAEQRLDLEISLEWMARANNILAAAQKRLSRPRGRQPIYGQLYELVHRLDIILQAHTFGKIDRSKKVIRFGTITSLEFVWLVVQAVDREVSKDRVQSVVASYVTDRLRSERQERERDKQLPESEALNDDGE